MAVVERFRGLVRAALGLNPNPGAPPDIVRLGLYPATVQACASDGSKCDVAPVSPFDALVASEKNVEVLVGIPGALATMQQGAVVLLGWRGGDPARPYCMPAWALGATVTKLTFNAQTIELAGNTYAMAKWDDFLAYFNTFLAALKVDLTAGSAGGCTTTSCASPIVVATYKSTKVKNG